MVMVLGWNPADRKVYYVVYSGGDTGYLPQVFYFDLTSQQPTASADLMLWPLVEDK